MLIPLLLALAACGGSGSGGSSSGGGSGNPTLRGVASTGAPLGGASVSVIDASGAAVGSGTTLAADGSYQLTLSTASPRMPLLVEVSGLSARGDSVVLHSTVLTLSSSMVANVTTLSEAIVAMAMGTLPSTVFAAPGQNQSSLSLLAAQTAPAQTFLTTLIKTNVSDAKLAGSFDLLNDPAYAANKTGTDVLVEAVRADVSKSALSGYQLNLVNKLQPNPAAEVVVNLAKLKTELAKGASATPTNAITSTLTATTGASATVANFGSLDALVAALNQLLAQGSNAATLGASSLLSGYTVHNGVSKTSLAAKLANMASNNWQIGRWQVTGCADAALGTSSGCTKVLVSALVTDSSGNVKDSLATAVSYTKTSTPNWNLVGNGQAISYSIWPMAWAEFAGDGTLNSTPATNPNVGVRIELQAKSLDSPFAQVLSSATVQTAGGYSIAMAYCALGLMCITPTTGATTTTATGTVTDTSLVQGSAGWIGTADAVRGAKFIASFTPTGGAATTQPAYLQADVPVDLGSTRFPAVDGLSSSAMLHGSDLNAGRSYAWTTWAKANLDMHMIAVRVVRGDGTNPVEIHDVNLGLPLVTSTTLPADPLSSGATASVNELWLMAQDSLGHRYMSRYILQP